MKLTVEERRCAACNIDISQKSPRAVFCSPKCYSAPRFLGTYCIGCGAPLVVAPGNKNQTKTCSARCRFLLENPDFNENYFDVPTIENSYWAGFIAADGCIYQNPNPTKSMCLSIKLQSGDKGHLVKFQDVIGAGGIYEEESKSPSSDKKCYASKYMIVSDKICLDLAKSFNIHSRKSLTHKPPNLDGDFAKAFLAGYIDGDGWYSIKNNRPRLGMCGTKEMLIWGLDQMDVAKAPTSRPPIYWVEIYGNDAIEVRQWFLDLGVPLLDRKKDKWERNGCNIVNTRRREE